MPLPVGQDDGGRFRWRAIWVGVLHTYLAGCEFSRHDRAWPEPRELLHLVA